MLHKLFTVTEWGIGVVSSLGLALSLFFVMFADSPAFMDKLNPLQKFAFQEQGLFLICIPGVVLVSFVLQFFIKNVNWNHIVGGVGLIGILYLLVFFSAY